MKAGEFISLENLDVNQKEKQLIEHGIPGLSLIRLPGHIMLYVGTKEDKAYAFHSLWGLKTKADDTTHFGRAILGQAAITPFDSGSKLYQCTFVTC